MPHRAAWFRHSLIEQAFFFAPCATYLPPCTAAFSQPSNSHRLRAGPCFEHTPAVFTFSVHPGWEDNTILRFAPWEMHRPPCTTLLEQLGCEHFLGARFGSTVLATADLVFVKGIRACAKFSGTDAVSELVVGAESFLPAVPLSRSK